MNSSSISLERLLEAGGFVLEGVPATGLLDANKASETAKDQLRYGDLLDGTATPFGAVADLVYEVPSDLLGVPGSTCAYFKTLQDPTPERILELRKRVWNDGRSPTLWVVTPDSILIYDTFARPQIDDGEKSHLLQDLKLIDHQLLRMASLDRSAFDSGEFWRTGPGRQIDGRERVDASLLTDLATTERLLIRQGLPVEVAHALLGRAIFAAYLWDRRIIGPSFLEQYGCESLIELFDSKETTYTFFEWLRQTFNGDLFPLSSNEAGQVELHHLDVIQQFLSGAEMSSYPAAQARLWPYLFDVIPIELISSIYEMFSHTRDPKRAEATSVHYTRLKLVELVLGLAMQGLDDTAVILDPACGSGVFLVEAFRRLVWMRQERLGRPLSRTELHDLLRFQIFGIDIDHDAVEVAAFSLYLALLEMDPDPYPPATPRLPRLSSVSVLEDWPPNLYCQDAFNTEHAYNRHYPFVDRNVSLIVGNPPWTALNSSTAPRDPDDPSIGPKWGLNYCQEKGIPDCKPDQGFMLRVREFARSDTRIALVVASRLFYQQPTTLGTWLERFLDDNSVETVVNFTDLVGENLLFGGTSSTRLPASVVVYYPRPAERDSAVTYLSPKWTPDAKFRDDLVVTSADMVNLPQSLLQRHRYLWKSAFYGTARDFRLLRMLEQLPSLEFVLDQMGIRDRGLGVQFGKLSQRDASHLVGKPFLDNQSEDRYRIAVEQLPTFDVPTAERPRGPWGLPALLAFRSLRADRACASLAEPTQTRNQIVVDKMYCAISLQTASEGFASRLNALLNSKLAFYSAFMRSPALGWDRRLIEMSDWLATPIPMSVIEGGGGWEEVQRHELWLRRYWEPGASPQLAEAITNVERAMNNAIYQVYDLSAQESILIEDAVRHTIIPLLSRKRSSKNALAPFDPASLEQLEEYAACLLEQLNGVLRYAEMEVGATVIAPRRSPVIACRLSTDPPSGIADVNRVAGDIQVILNQISHRLRSQVTDHIFVRKNLRVYDNDTVWIIKPAEGRLWTSASALQDADTVIREHMETEALAVVP